MKTNSRLIVRNALMKVFFHGSYSNIVFNNEVKNSNLSQLDISFAAALFYGVVSKKITLDYVISLYSKVKLKKMSNDVIVVLRMGVYQILFMDKVPDSAAVNESVNLLSKGNAARGFVNAVLRTVSRTKNTISYDSQAVKYSCPEWLINFFCKSYGFDVTEKILKSLEHPPNITLRTNTTRTSTKNLLDSLEQSGIEACELYNNFEAISVKSIVGIEKLPEFERGEFHVQDLASQICCSVLNPSPGDVVVDMCAAPGGKSFTIAELMNGQGKVLTFDLHESKVNLIKKGATRLGLRNVVASARDSTLPFEKENFADKVLCDVPCSGLGVIRRKPEIKYKDENWFKDLPDLQLKLLQNAAKIVKVSGVIVYSTCTLNPEENGGVIKKFLDANKNFCAEGISLPIEIVREVDEPKSQITIIPGANNSDGFFISLLRKLR